MNMNWFSEIWCKLMHPAPMWPIGGYYKCPKCFRQYAVEWANQPHEAATLVPGANVLTMPRSRAA